MSNLSPINRRGFLISCLALQSTFLSGVTALAQPVANFKPFSFIFVSDCHLSSGVTDSFKLTQESQLFLQEVVKQINLLKPDFVIFGGDQVDGPGEEEANWQFFVDVMHNLDCSWYFVLGETDVSSGNSPVNKMHIYGRDWRGNGLSNSQPYWSYDALPGVHLIGLDTSVANSLTGFVSDEQLDWLKNDISQQSQAITLLISHHPLLPPPPPFDEGKEATQYLLPQAPAVRQILQNYNKPVFSLSGHVHINKIVRENNVFYISSPSLDVYPCAFRYFQVTSQQIETKIYQVNFPSLVKKAKSSLLNSSLASELTEGKPHNFINQALGSRSDQNLCLDLSIGEAK